MSSQAKHVGSRHERGSAMIPASLLLPYFVARPRTYRDAVGKIHPREFRRGEKAFGHVTFSDDSFLLRDVAILTSAYPKKTLE